MTTMCVTESFRRRLKFTAGWELHPTPKMNIDNVFI